MKIFKKLIILTFSVILLLNCQKEKELDEIISLSNLEKISQQNKSFFDKLEGLKGETQNEDFNLKLKQIVIDYEKSNIAIAKFSKKQETITLLQEEILKKYFEGLDNHKSKIDFANSYLLQVQNLNINEKDKLSCLNAIDFHKNLMIYVDYNNSKNNTQVQAERGCAHRGCMDCCMYRKAQDLSNSNFFDKAMFILTAASSTAQWFGSCGWDCI